MDAALRGFVPFPPERATTYRESGYWTSRPLDSVLRQAAADWPERVGVVDANDSHTFAELDELADRAAAGFAALSIAPGDRVLLQLPNCCRFAIAFFGLLRAGAIPVMCLPGHRLAELTHFAAVSGAVGLVIADTAGGFDYRTMAEKLVAAHPRCATLSSTEIPAHSGRGRTCPTGPPPTLKSTRLPRRCCWYPAAPPACRN